jgi:hypothetical protein
MTILVIAEPATGALTRATLATIGAAKQIGGEIHVLLVGERVRPLAEAAARVRGVRKVLVAEAPHLGSSLAEDLAPIIIAVARDYGHVLAPATTFGKNLLPRVAALLDVAPISDIVAVESADTFVRPIYAGNVLATVQATDSIKVLTVRGTAFAAVPAEGGEATIEPVPVGTPLGLSRYVGQELGLPERAQDQGHAHGDEVGHGRGRGRVRGAAERGGSTRARRLQQRLHRVRAQHHPLRRHEAGKIALRRCVAGGVLVGREKLRLERARVCGSSVAGEGDLPEPPRDQPRHLGARQPHRQVRLPPGEVEAAVVPNQLHLQPGMRAQEATERRSEE